MIEALLLGRQYGYAALKVALEKALDLSCFDIRPKYRSVRSKAATTAPGGTASAETSPPIQPRSISSKLQVICLLP